MLTTQRVVNSLLDEFADFDFKKKFNSLNILAPVQIASWVDVYDQRRLRAYAMLDAYCHNKGRVWSEAQVEEETAGDPSDRREYGDPYLIVETHLSSLLGDEWSIVTEGAVAPEATEQSPAVIQQRLLDQWSELEKFPMKVIEGETQSIKFGDSVYALGWDAKMKRPRLHVYDPGFYFPRFEEREGGAEEFPRVVDIAWEFEEETGPDKKTETFVRRIRWELLSEDDEGNAWNYSVRYQSEAATENCSYRDEIWTLKQAVEGFTGRPKEEITAPTWLGLDFIPLVHVPNTVNIQGHFGKSALANVLQIVDDIASVDTDLQAAAATTGSPPIAINHAYGVAEKTSYGPGTILNTGDGTATLIDTSRSLDALLKLKDALLERLSVNSRTPESMLGRVKPNEVPSGIALTLSFTPHSGLIKKMRLVRDDKYKLLLKFVLRMYIQNDQLTKPAGDMPVSMMKFGSFLPADKQEVMTLTVQLLAAKAISLETAVIMLIDAGYPIEDWVEEISRIQARDYEAAQQIMAITGNPEYAAEFLGIPAAEVLPDMEDALGEEGEPGQLPPGE